MENMRERNKMKEFWQKESGITKRAFVRWIAVLLLIPAWGYLFERRLKMYFVHKHHIFVSWSITLALLIPWVVVGLVTFIVAFVKQIRASKTK